MHRLIAYRMGLLSTDFPEVDHVDRNGLNNCRSNLRKATRSQNAVNRKARGFSIERGRRKPYKVMIAGKHIGRFATEQEAVEAYNTARIEMYGEYAS